MTRSTLSTLLQNADPALHEPPLADGERARIRDAVVRAATVESKEVPMRGRLAFVAALGAATITAFAFGGEILQRWAPPLSAAVRFEVRLAEELPSPGLTVARVEGAGELIYVHPDVVVDNSDVVQAWVEPNDDKFGVAVQLTQQGAQRLRAASAAHLGRRIALFIDGRAVAAPVVRSAIGDVALISGSYTKAEADRLASGIQPR